jgi:predicted enzyme related to lactoylglutathione lyase
MTGPIHFEIQVDDIERAKTFYTAAFGWAFQDFGQMTGSPYWGITAGAEGEPGINGGLLPRSGAAPAAGSGANAFVCTMGVADFDDTERKILAAGGQVVLPKLALTGMAWQGYYLDTEGNTFGIHQPDPEAK